MAAPAAEQARLSPSSTVLIAGAGYIGQFLIVDFLEGGWKVGYTYLEDPAYKLYKDHPDVQAFEVDFATGRGLQECMDKLGPLARVVNCAAVNDRTACEAHEAGAAAVNVPSQLLDALDQHIKVHGYEPFLVHLSTDQVYEGARALAPEWAALGPEDAFGRTKLAGEKAVAARWPRHAILRHSLLFGPPPPSPVHPSKTWLQTVDAQLKAGKGVELPNDQWLTPTYVRDLVRAVQECFRRQDSLPNRVLNVGGPDRLSLFDMGQALAQVRGHNQALVAASSSTTPRDVSMSCSRAQRDLSMQFVPFKIALLHTFKSEAVEP